MKIQLCAEDAARVGCPELVEYDETKLMGREAIAVQKQTGWRPEKLARAMQGRAADEAGEPQYRRDDRGDLVLDDDGKPIPLRDVDAEALLIMAWIAVRRVKPSLLYADFDIDLFGTQFGEDIGDQDDGRADEPADSDGSGKS